MRHTMLEQSTHTENKIYYRSHKFKLISPRQDNERRLKAQADCKWPWPLRKIA